MNLNLRDALQSIYDRDGRLTPRSVLDSARHPDSPLHNKFEWNDSVAAERYRLAQAGDLIRKVKIKHRPDKPARVIREFVSVHNADGYAYHPTRVVAVDDRMRTVVLAEMEREWKALKQRYGHLAEFMTMVRSDLG